MRYFEQVRLKLHIESFDMHQCSTSNDSVRCTLLVAQEYTTNSTWKQATEHGAST